MARMFYLSIVFDADGYNRYDIVKDSSLKKIDDLISNYNNRDEVINDLAKEYINSIKNGRLCIVYEDLDQKKKEQEEFHQTGNEYANNISRELTYAHIIPVMYKKERLLNTETCLSRLKSCFLNPKIKDSIMHDKIIEKNGQKIELKTNKRYIFETEEEKDFLNKQKNENETLDHFYIRLKKRTNKEDQYFYFRVLMNICNLSYKEKTINKLDLHQDNLVKYMKNSKKNINEIDITDLLEEESRNMDEFYTYHDLDEVIKLSSDPNRPIGSEGRKRR